MILLAVLSPTCALASFLKSRFDRTRVIKLLNSIYLGFSIISVIGLVVYQFTTTSNTVHLYQSLPFIWLFIWASFLISRFNEIFYAFLKDALDKLSNFNQSKLSPKDRIVLALRSYVELIIDFAILYLLLPADKYWWTDSKTPSTIVDALYFSGVTITTLGYGDISPAFWFSRLLVIYEVFCGFILLIVCFTIYTNKSKP